MAIKDVGGVPYDTTVTGHLSEEAAKPIAARLREQQASIHVAVGAAAGVVVGQAQAAAARAEDAAGAAAGAVSGMVTAAARTRRWSAPTAGAWSVGADWRGRRVQSGDTAARTRRWSAPTAGAWSVGDDWRSIRLDKPLTPASLPADLDARLTEATEAAEATIADIFDLRSIIDRLDARVQALTAQEG